jgi:hypothetical protein
MNIKMLMIFVLFVGLMGGNFAYQAMFEQHWIVAVERSFFQAAALLGVMLYEYFGVFD